MWVLLALSAVAAVVFVERALYLHRGQIRSTAFLTGIKNILAKRRLIEAITVCEETPGPVAVVVKAALLHHEADESKLRLAVQEAALIELPTLERRMGALAAIAQVAPLLGLLGTVLGMLRTFHAFMQGGHYATPAALSGGCGRRCSPPRSAWRWPSPPIWRTTSCGAACVCSPTTWSGRPTRSSALSSTSCRGRGVRRAPLPAAAQRLRPRQPRPRPPPPSRSRLPAGAAEKGKA
jgi:biopolymer transport protein ExbB